MTKTRNGPDRTRPMLKPGPAWSMKSMTKTRTKKAMPKTRTGPNKVTKTRTILRKINNLKKQRLRTLSLKSCLAQLSSSLDSFCVPKQSGNRSRKDSVFIVNHNSTNHVLLLIEEENKRRKRIYELVLFNFSNTIDVPPRLSTATGFRTDFRDSVKSEADRSSEMRF